MMTHLAACTVTALIALAAATALRGRSARLRYGLILAAILRFALPTAWIADAGRRIAPLDPVRAVALAPLGHLASLLDASLDSSFTRPAARQSDVRDFHLLPFLWAVGFAAAILLWTVGARRTRRSISSVRPASPEEMLALGRASAVCGKTCRADSVCSCSAGGLAAGSLEASKEPAARPSALQATISPIRNMETPGAACGVTATLLIAARGQAAGVRGIRRPAIVIPDGLSAVLSAAELESVLAHELVHIERRDNLTAAIAHLVVCAFWFYPLVWWMERRALREREAACDELVLRRGANAETYLAAILKVCRLSFAPVPGFAAASGASLRHRMQFILSARFRRPAPRAVRVTAVALLAGAMLAPMGSALEIAQPVVVAMQRAAAAVPMSIAPTPPVPLQVKPRAARNRRLDKAQVQPQESKPSVPEQPPQPFRGTIHMMPAEKFDALQRQLAQAPMNRKFFQIHPHIRGSRAAEAVNAGIAQLEAGNAMGAEESFRMALAFDPANFDAAMGIASMLMEQGRVGAAEEFLTQHKPAFWNEDPAVTLRFAVALDRAGDWRNAEKAYSIVIALEPKNGTALNNLAYLLTQHGGDLDDAVMYAERAAKQMPDSAEAADTLGNVHIQRGELDAAFEAFQALLQKAPEHAEHLAILLAAKGRGDAVREKITAALANNPSPSAGQALQAILSKLR